MTTRILVVDDSPTLRRVVAAILERHGYDTTLAADGQEAMESLTSDGPKPDLVLLDFVMPRMNGFQFCRELRRNPELTMLPVVLMSAKADRIRDQFVEQTGAVDAITKPFDRQALVAVVENALRRVTSGRASSTRMLETTGDELSVTDVTSQAELDSGSDVSLADEDEPDAFAEEEAETRARGARIVGTKLAHLVTRTLADRPEASPGELASALSDKLARETLFEMLDSVRALEEGQGTGKALLEGEMSVVPIGAVLQLLQAERLSGVLTCVRAGATVTAVVREGLIDVVRSAGAGDEFRLGRYFVEEGILTPEEIDRALAEPESEVRPATGDDASDEPRSSERRVKPLLGRRLLEAGKITGEQLRDALTRQSSELLYEVLRWQKGRFFYRRTRRREDDAPGVRDRLGMPVAGVVMEGFRRVDEWRVIERSLGSFDAVLVRDDGALGEGGEEGLPARERTVLSAATGERTVREIVRASNMSSFDACRILAQFMEARVLRVRALKRAAR